MKLAIGLIIGFVIGAGVVFLIFDRLITRFIKTVDDAMAEIDLKG